MKKIIAQEHLVYVLPAVLTVFIIFIILLPKAREGKVGNIPKNNIQNINWKQAIDILNQGEVKSVFQTHNLDVSLVLEDGSIFKTREPAIDDIFTEVEKCGSPCSDVILATE